MKIASTIRLGAHLFSLCCSCALLTVHAATEFFVAPDGNDNAAGNAAQPFATLEAARNAVRALKSSSGLPEGGVTVWIRGGTYSRQAPFELTKEDSGTSSSPIIYRSVEGQSVRLIGGRALRNFERVIDASVLSRLRPEARSQVWQVDLGSLGIKEFGAMQSRGFSRPITISHPELFFKGQPLTLARWPNEGAWERIAGFPEGTGEGDEHGGTVGRLEEGFSFSSERPHEWSDLDDVWVHGYWSWDWANSYERVAAIDLDKHLVKTAPPHGLYGFRKGQRFYFLNILEELDEPGEWFLDRKAAKLYVWPPASRKDDQTGFPAGEWLLSLLPAPLVTTRDVSHVTFRALQLEATRGTAVEIRGGTNVQIAGCAIRMIGDYGVWVEGGQGHRVVSCDIENTGDGGVSLSGGDRQTLSPGGHVVENCHFQKQGRWSKCYVPAVLLSGVGQRVEHNLMHDHPHCAILFTGNDHQIEYNEIHHVALETGDVGAIYEGRDWTFRGNAIRYNFIHETGGVGMGSMGVYMDDCVSGAEIFGNVFYKVTRAAFLGGGRDHRVENNIFVDCRPAVQLDGRGLDRSPVWYNMVYDFMKTQLAAVPAGLYQERYPQITNVVAFYQNSTNGIPPEGNSVVRNICVGGEWMSVGWHARPEMMDVRDNFIDTAPGFMAPWEFDFRPAPYSPVYDFGFQPIPMERMGLIEDSFRRLGQIEALASSKSP